MNGAEQLVAIVVVAVVAGTAIGEWAKAWGSRRSDDKKDS